MSPQLPDKITLFQQSIEQVAKTPEEIRPLFVKLSGTKSPIISVSGHDRIHIMEERWRRKRDGKEGLKYGPVGLKGLLQTVAPHQRSEGWSGIRESNSRLKLGKLAYYHCTNPAG